MTQEQQQPDRKTGSSETGERLADEGDVLGLLDFLQDDASPLVLRDAMALLSRCIRTKSRLDVSGLCDASFARIIGLATLLHSRIELFIADRLTEAEKVGGHVKSGLPADLIDQGWLERAERIARFISEMATTRSRVQHVNRLNQQADAKRNGVNSNWLNDRSPMDSHPRETGSRQGHPRNGGFNHPADRIQFT